MRRLLISLGILVVLLAVLDRVGVAVADRAVAKEIRTELSLRQTPSVHIHGFPFLLQAIRGQYDDVEVQIPSVDSGPLHNMRVDARLHQVKAPLDRMVSGQLNEVPVRDIIGSLAVGYDDLARASGIPGLKITPSGSALRVQGRVPVAGQQIDASARASISVVDNDLVITADQAEVGGVALPPAALAVAARLLSFRVSPKALPLDLRITGVLIGSDSLTVSAQAHNVVLRRGALPTTTG